MKKAKLKVGVSVSVKDKSKEAKAKDEMKLIGLEKEKNAILLGVQENYPVLLVGETGIGKTYSLQHVAKEQKKRIIRMSLNGEVGINEILGKWLIKNGSTYWQDGILIDAMRSGYWLICDEINAALPEVLFVLNPLMDDAKSIVLAEKDGEQVHAHKDFRIFATMNPCDEYAGTKEMNKALLSRFPIVLHYTNYKPDTELEIVKYQSGIDDTIARCMIDVANAIRGLKRDKVIYHTVSTRDIVNWARVFGANGNSVAEAFEFSILNKANEEEREQIVKAATTATEVKISWSWKKEHFRKLTADIQVEIDKLQEKRKKMLEALAKVESQMSVLKSEVEK